MDIHSEISELRKRVAVLEQSASRTRRGRTNQAGAARYLGRSEEWLRQRHARDEGPRRTKRGRFWDYTFDDLDEFAEQSTA
jgi:hypothetical protein